ncbi:hypothetical protein TRFO_21446 [Tritrichomonas foetus]|uniref:DH domain-containing protein n=1 Tax=Tritrichomonas foetus TaxID=1144522 RepID=A0A1J4KEL0_9EUKA|nr:hypothetical protein TRFO_21446 [Tritrichomonas foetus]|eukprot:OHT09635.1 hypothetical protein TRFO_21446 [Tritrichomonas foetus]
MADKFPLIEINFVPENSTFRVPAIDIVGHSTTRIIEYTKEQKKYQGELFLEIVSFTGSTISVPDKILPCQLCPELCFLPSFQQNPSFYIRVSQINPNGMIFVCIPVVSIHGELLYKTKFYFPFKDFNIRNLIHYLRRIHQCEKNMFCAYSRFGETYEEPKDRKHFFNDFLIGHFFISFFPSSSIKKLIIIRTKATEEFKTTEINYYNTLSGFETNVGSILQKTNFLSQSEKDSLLKAANIITNLHREICDDLRHMEIDFMTPIGKWFSKYIPFLKVYHQYVSLYNMIIGKITNAMSSKEYAKIFQEFVNSEYAHGLLFDSILIIPVQRGPRYMILLKEITKNTPEKHPDRENLVEAMQLTKITLDSLETDISKSISRQELLKLEKKFDKKVKLIQPNRILIGQFEASSVIKSNLERMLIIIFSDECWICQNYTLKERVNYNNYEMCKYSERSVFIRNDESLAKIYSFETVDKRDECLKCFRNLSINYQKGMRDQIKLSSQEIKPSKKIELEGHSMVYVKEFLWMFGGKDMQGNVKSELRKISVKTGKVFVRDHDEESDPQVRYDSCMIYLSVSNTLCIFGGRNNSQSFNDMWLFYIDSNEWKKISPKNNDKNSHEKDDENIPPPGHGYSMSQINEDIIFITGGIDEYHSYKFYFKEMKWERTKLKKGLKIKSLNFHSFLPIPKISNGGLIIGGQSKKAGKVTINDYMFFIKNFGEICDVVKHRRISPASRVHHSCVRVNDYALVFGGTDETITFCFDLNDMTWLVPQFEGAPILASSKFAIAQNDKTIWIHGGLDDDSKIISNLYMIDLQFQKNEFILDKINFERDQFVYNMLQNPKSMRDNAF